MNAEKKRIEAFKRERKQVRFFFQPGQRRFNIFVTLADYCGGYPRARGWGGVFLMSTPGRGGA